MSKQIILGKDQKGNPVHIDLKVFLRTRGLVQAASGGGKSRTLRRLGEQFFGKVPTWIIDRDEEFPSLREKFGYVLVGQGGETPTDIRSAEIVCQRLLENHASAIFSLYGLKDPDRHEWVKLFLTALMNAPKKLWQDLVLMVDEAHRFAPQKDKSVALGPMVDVACDGRKHGICAVYFTQRLGKVSKNASAELLNRCVGNTVEDIDLDRASDLFSVRSKDRHDFEESLKHLKPGEFYCFGPAISTDRTLVKVGPVVTTHPEPGSPSAAAPPPLPEKMRALLPKLADLPKEAETKARTEAELRAEIRSLKAKLSAKPIAAALTVQAAPVVKTEIRKVEVPVLKEAELRRVEKAIGRAEKILERLDGFGKPVEEASRALRSTVGVLRTTAQAPLTSNQRTMAIALGSALRTQAQAPQQQTRELAKNRLKPLLERPRVPKATEEDAEEKPLVAGERRMLEVLAKFNPGSRTKAQIAQLSGYTMSGGTFSNYYNRLKKGGLIEEKSDKVTITGKGLEIFGGRAPEGPMNSEELLSMWRDKLIAGERKLLDALVQVYPEPLSKEDLGKETGYESSGGTFSNYLSTLRRNDLAVVDGNMVRAHEGLFQLTG